jgi:hypothetical protein
MNSLLIKLAKRFLWAVVGGWWLFQKATHIERAAWEAKAQAQKIEALGILASAQVEAAKTDSRNEQVIKTVNQRSHEDEQRIHDLSTKLRSALDRLRLAESRPGAGSSCPLPQTVTSAGNSQASGAQAGGVLPTRGAGSPPVDSNSLEFEGIKKMAELAIRQASEADEINVAYRACNTVLTDR